MDVVTEDAFNSLIQRALHALAGQRPLGQAQAAVAMDYAKKRFNVNRAIEIFQISTERAIWDELGSSGAMTTRATQGSGVIETIAVREATDFQLAIGARDQRPARQGMLSRIIGK
jgi:hypothetical protein